MSWLMIIFALVGGILVGIQAGVNGILGSKIGAIEGAFISFFTGTLALLLVVIFFGRGNLLAVTNLPKWQLIGGLLGAAYVFILVLTVPKIGVASVLMAIIVGQVLSSTVIDHFGLFGGRQIPIDWRRITGLIFLAVALLLIYRK